MIANDLLVLSSSKKNTSSISPLRKGGYSIKKPFDSGAYCVTK
jgi:hypothetical protein